MRKYRYIKLDEKWLKKLRETAHFYSADIVCGVGTDWILKTAEAENKTLFEIISYLENAPSEDVAEVRHGHWIEPSYGELQCSACGIVQEDYPQRYDFCPYCGAKMRECNIL